MILQCFGQELLINIVIVKMFNSLRTDLQTGSNKTWASLSRVQQKGPGHEC